MLQGAPPAAVVMERWVKVNWPRTSRVRRPPGSVPGATRSLPMQCETAGATSAELCVPSCRDFRRRTLATRSSRICSHSSCPRKSMWRPRGDISRAPAPGNRLRRIGCVLPTTLPRKPLRSAEKTASSGIGSPFPCPRRRAARGRDLLARISESRGQNPRVFAGRPQLLVITTMGLDFPRGGVRTHRFVVRRSSFVVRRSSFVVRRSSFVVRRTGGSGNGGSSGEGNAAGDNAVGGAVALGGASGSAGSGGGGGGTGGAEASCTQSGGTVRTAMCCANTSDFPMSAASARAAVLSATATRSKSVPVLERGPASMATLVGTRRAAAAGPAALRGTAADDVSRA
jgi:hypothetical protein